MVKKIRKFIIENQLLDSKDKVLVALSGGADSVCLLHVLLALRQEFSLDIAAVHVNHQLRGEEAERDAQFCMNLCKQCEVLLHMHTADVRALASQQKQSVETAARNVRYACFDTLCQEHGYTKIAVAHNAQDNAETVLMHLLRGSGVDGLRGILPKRERIVRPLLCVDREEIECYLQEKSLNCVTDSTNAELQYGRNRIRHDLLKQILEKYNPNFIHTIFESSYLLANDSAYLQSVAQEAAIGILTQAGETVCINAEKYVALDDAIALRVMKHAISQCVRKSQDIAFDTILRCHRLCVENAVGGMVDLLNGATARMEHGRLLLGVMEERRLYCYPLSKNTSIEIEPFNAVLHSFVTDRAERDSAHTVCFDLDKITKPLVVRNRREGDRILLSGLNGTKKLKSYFIDAKIPKSERDMWPLLCCGDDVLWICGMRKSALYAANEKTKNVLKITYEVTKQ